MDPANRHDSYLISGWRSGQVPLVSNVEEQGSLSADAAWFDASERANPLTGKAEDSGLGLQYICLRICLQVRAA